MLETDQGVTGSPPVDRDKGMQVNSKITCCVGLLINKQTKAHTSFKTKSKVLNLILNSALKKKKMGFYCHFNRKVCNYFIRDNSNNCNMLCIMKTKTLPNV